MQDALDYTACDNLPQLVFAASEHKSRWLAAAKSPAPALCEPSAAFPLRFDAGRAAVEIYRVLQIRPDTPHDHPVRSAPHAHARLQGYSRVCGSSAFTCRS